MQTWQKYLAEALGTLILVGIGTGTILATLTTQTCLQAAVPLGFGLAVLVALYSVGEVSGGHFNPAVSLGMFMDRRITMSDLIGYWISQFAGGILGSVTVMKPVPSSPSTAPPTRILYVKLACAANVTCDASPQKSSLHAIA